MEKSGLLTLTQEEFDLIFSEERIPTRILSQWGISVTELRSILTVGQYKIVDDN